MSAPPGADALRLACDRLWAAEAPNVEAVAPGAGPPTYREGRPPAEAAPPPRAGEVAGLAAALRSGETTSVELAERALRKAETTQRVLGCFVELTAEGALADARRADAELAAGRDRGPLQGIPTALKDVIDLGGVATRNGTRAFGHRVPAEDSVAAHRLRSNGAVIIGKTRTHELAWGTVTHGVANPFDATRSPGGSSGGSAAAVAAGIVPFAIGTDTGGSIRIPAALCGIAGLRPTHGSLDLSGVTRLAPSQDTLGPLAGTADDCLAVLAALRGSPVPGRAVRPQEMRIGLVSGGWVDRVDEAVHAAQAHAAAVLRAADAVVLPVRVPLAGLAPAASYVVMLSESACVWRRARRSDPGVLTSETESLLRLGDAVTAPDYLRARQVAAAIRTAVLDTMAMNGLDLLLLPATATTALPRTAGTVEVAGRSEPASGALSRLAALAAVSGLPALSIPCGLDRAGLPIGVQVIGGPGGEAGVCSAGAVVEAGGGAEAVGLRRAQVKA